MQGAGTPHGGERTSECRCVRAFITHRKHTRAQLSLKRKENMFFIIFQKIYVNIRKVSRINFHVFRLFLGAVSMDEILLLLLNEFTSSLLSYTTISLIKDKSLFF